MFYYAVKKTGWSITVLPVPKCSIYIYKFYGMNFGYYVGYDATLAIMYCKLHQN